MAEDEKPVVVEGWAQDSADRLPTFVKPVEKPVKDKNTQVAK